MKLRDADDEPNQQYPLKLQYQHFRGRVHMLLEVAQHRMFTHQSSQVRKRRSEFMNRQILPIQFAAKDRNSHSMWVILASVSRRYHKVG